MEVFRRICEEYGTDVFAHVKHSLKMIISKKKQDSAQKVLEKAHEGDVQFNISDSLGARMAHCVVEDTVKDLFTDIYSCSGDRAALDNKAIRVDQLWGVIADSFFNNPEWQLELFDSLQDRPAGAGYIDPRTPPDDSHRLSGLEFQGKFNLLKTCYSVVSTKWMASGQMEGGGDGDFEEQIDSDAIFYENFAKHWYPEHSKLLLYCHLLWKRRPPAFCLRTLPEDVQQEVGVPDCRTPSEQKLS